jgi:hypothetical protein
MLFTYSLWEDHTTNKASTICTPFQIIYVQEAILPTELDISSLRIMLHIKELNSSNVPQRINALLSLEEQRNFPLENIKRRHQTMSKYSKR